MATGSPSPDSSAKSLLDFPALAGAFKSPGRLVVAVSGGADSVALLTALHDLSGSMRLELKAVHANHVIRADSDADEQFVKDLCSRLGVELYTERRHATGSAEHLSESDLRTFRYGVYRNAAAHFATSMLVLGHTSDDLVETLLMNLMRGSGLGAYRFRFRDLVDDIVLLRPLWKTSHAKVFEFLERRGIAFRNDPTNDSTVYTRNRVRHVLLPMLEKEFNPQVQLALLRSAEALGSAQELVQDLAWSALQNCEYGPLKRPKLFSMDIVNRPRALGMEMLRFWIQHWQPKKTFLSQEKLLECYEVMKAGTVKIVQLPGGGYVVTEMLTLFGCQEQGSDQAPSQLEIAKLYARELEAPLAKVDAPISICSPGEVEVPTFSGKLRVQVRSDCGEILELRNRRPGDRLVGGPRLKDVLINDKVPYYIRDYLLLLATPEGEVLHVIDKFRLNGRIEWAEPTRALDVEITRIADDDNSLAKGT